MSDGSHEAARAATVDDLMFDACGESIESLRGHIVAVDLDGVAVRTLDLEGLLKAKRTARDKGRVDRAVLEQALQAIRRGTPP